MKCYKLLFLQQIPCPKANYDVLLQSGERANKKTALLLCFDLIVLLQRSVKSAQWAGKCVTFFFWSFLVWTLSPGRYRTIAGQHC